MSTSIFRNITSFKNFKKPNTFLYYFPILGQSQAGGFQTAPSLTTTGSDYVKTLTSGPIDVSLSGSLINSVEGDTFSDTNGGGTSSNVETIATSFGQQLRAFRGSIPADFYVVSVHARGGETIQALAKGGSTARYEEITASVQNVKNICDTLRYNLIVHPIFLHGGTGDNVGTTYKDKLLNLYTDFNDDIKGITGQQDLYLFTHQQRIIGSPDYGIQQYEASVTQSNIVVVGPEYPLLLGLGGGISYQGDMVHWRNHGTRYMGQMWSQAVYSKLFGSGYGPLELIPTSHSVDSGKLVIPINNVEGELSINSKGGIQVSSGSNLITTQSLSGSNLVIEFNTPLSGPHVFSVSTGLTVSGSIKSISSFTSSFLDSSSVPYPLDKYMVRAIYSVSSSL